MMRHFFSDICGVDRGGRGVLGVYELEKGVMEKWAIWLLLTVFNCCKRDNGDD